MEDLVRWLGEQLDEDERILRAAADEARGEVWQYDGHYVRAMPEDDMVAVGSQDFMEAGVGEHVAEWDPARVLREIDAKRRIMECHEPWTASNGDTICGRCGREHIDGRPGGHFPCQTLRLLALPYTDRTGYRDEWRP